MPCYNAEKYLEIAIKSVINQSYTNIELIIINDCSSDNSKAIINRYKISDNRIITIDHTINIGVSAARNHGIERSQGKYIAFCDADDFWKPNKLKEQFRCFAPFPEYDLTFTNSSIVNENSESNGMSFNQKYRFDIDKNGDYFKQLLLTNFINTSTVIIKSSCIRNALLFDPTISIGEDWLFWIQISQKHKILYINQSLSYYRIHNTNCSGINPKIFAESRIQTLFAILKLNLKLQAFYKSVIHYKIGIEYLVVQQFDMAQKEFIKSIIKNPFSIKSLARLCQIFFKNAVNKYIVFKRINN